MYENENTKTKTFTLEKVELSQQLTEEQVNNLFKRFNITVGSSKGVLTIEKYINNMDSNIDYDISLRTASIDVPLKTSNKYENVEKAYNNYLVLSTQN